MAWPHGATKEWSDELRDSRQDLYAIDDGAAGECGR